MAEQIVSQKVALHHHYSLTKANDSFLKYEKPTGLQEPPAIGVDSKLSVLKYMHKLKLPIYSVLVNGNVQSRLPMPYKCFEMNIFCPIPSNFDCQ